MKQFHCPNLGRKLYTYDEIRDKFPGTLPAILNLEIGESAIDCDSDLWVRKDDVDDETLQDDVSMTETDVTQCRTSASCVRQSLRLERIATAAMVAWIPFTDLLSSRGLTPAQAAMNDARDLIAELDKQA